MDDAHSSLSVSVLSAVIHDVKTRWSLRNTRVNFSVLTLLSISQREQTSNCLACSSVEFNRTMYQVMLFSGNLICFLFFLRVILNSWAWLLKIFILSHNSNKNVKQKADKNWENSHLQIQFWIWHQITKILSTMISLLWFCPRGSVFNFYF